MVAKMANKSPGIEGMKLSRFDRVLGLNRSRLASIYRGEAQANGEMTGQRIEGIAPDEARVAEG